jgi:acyl-CoA hydrolase
MVSQKGKTVADSAIEDYTYRLFPHDLNANGSVFGGLIMSLLDRLALVIAERHSGCTCVTVSVDALHFLAPAGIEEHLIIKGAVNRVWKTSMEIGLKVIAHHPKTLEERHIVSAYFTFVALDEFQNPTPVISIIPKTTLEKRRFKEADLRRSNRVAHKVDIQNVRKSFKKS